LANLELPSPYYSEDGISIYHGDALDIIPLIEGVDAVVTDPPYSSGGAFRGDRTKSVTEKYVQNGTAAYRPEFGGDSRDQRSFLAWSALWLSAARSASKPGAFIASFIDWRQLPVLSDAIQAGGWTWRGIAVWDKTLNARPSAGVYTSQSEYVLWGTNGAQIRRELGYQIPGVFAQVSPPSAARVHIAQKPDPVMRWVLSIVPKGALVLDPFCGSGSTLRAARDLGLSAIGIESDAYYCEMSASLLAQRALPI
jgi:site-specific DNA-methyltransferase (adenine-specific)